MNISCDGSSAHSKRAESASNAEGAWARRAVTIRLSDRRRALLKALASDSVAPLWPTAAIDNAIELATQAGKRHEEVPRTAGLAAELEELASHAERRAAEYLAALGDMGLRIGVLGAAVEALAASLAPGANGADDGRLSSARAWLEKESRSLPKRAFLAKARWHSTTRIDDRHVAVDFFAERVAAAGLKGAAARGVPCLIRLGPLAKEDSFCELERVGFVYLMCSAGDGASEWTVAMHLIKDDMQPGPASASIAA